MFRDCCKMPRSSMNVVHECGSIEPSLSAEAMQKVRRAIFDKRTQHSRHEASQG
jgi:hypothetical protein